jgi:thiol-disulfide isomerase/thioredoxin
MQMKHLLIPAFLGCVSFAYAQQITGNFPALSNQYLKLQGFHHFDTYTIDSIQVDEGGSFVLKFATNDYGIGLLSAEGLRPSVVVLTDEQIAVSWKEQDEDYQLQVSQGAENVLFQQYINEQPKREQALSAWNYLQKMYNTDAHFNGNKKPIKAIQQEKTRIAKEESRFFQGLSEDSYIQWYIPMRKLLGSVARVAQYEPENIEPTRHALRKINYSDARLYKSGLLREALDNHVWFIENSSGSLDSVFADLNRSIDIMLDQLLSDEAKYNLVTDYLFKLLEKRSLFTSAEYLAIKVLNEQSCTVDGDLANQLEGYRKMKTGNTAPDILFSEYTYRPEGLQANRLSEIQANYKVVVFAAGWCGHCTEEIPKLANLYEEWKALGIEIVLVSLDESVNDFVRFAGGLPFTSTTGLQKWETPAAQDYHVFATPTMYLLDADQKILLKPKSVEHLKSWVDWRVKG